MSSLGQFLSRSFGDPVALATWALAATTALLTFVTAWLAISTGRGVKQSLRTDAFARMTTAWDSVEVRARRKRVAAWVLDHREEIPDTVSSGIADVVDFFEDVGTLMRPGRLDRILVWHAFADVSVGWWQAAGERYVRNIRKTDDDESLYSEYEYLIEKMQKITKRKNGKADRWTTDEITRFLKTERRLLLGHAR